jgi:putative iron-regulated protein
MSGERLAVALETRDQEEEHSCFSDTTDRDFKANMRGIAQVLRVGDANSPIEVVRAKDAAAADALAAALASAESAVAAIPAPFDASIRKPDGSVERERLARALEAVESLGEAVTRAAKALGYELPTEPQG